MKAISLWQPWASLMAIGAKTIETRSWSTTYRGPLAIHASKRLVLPNDPEFLKAVKDLGLLDRELPLGAIVGTCELYDCIPVEKATATFFRRPDKEILFGDWSPGRYLWLTQNFKRFDIPIPARGKQGLWDWEMPEGRSKVRLMMIGPCLQKFVDQAKEDVNDPVHGGDE